MVDVSQSDGVKRLRGLTSGPDRKSPGLHSPPGSPASPSSLLNQRLAFPIVALLVALAVGLLFLLPGGPLQAQDANGPIMYAENGTGPVATYTAVDPERTAIASWSLTGTDADAFTIVGGVLRFAKIPDYETASRRCGHIPVHSCGRRQHVRDHGPGHGQHRQDRREGGDGRGHQRGRRWHGDPLGAAAAGRHCLHRGADDPDGAATNRQWQWAKSRSKDGSYTDIDDNAEAATYTPTDASGKSDVGYYLRATVSYTDPEDSGKSAMMKSDYTVQATRGSNNAPRSPTTRTPPWMVTRPMRRGGRGEHRSGHRHWRPAGGHR